MTEHTHEFAGTCSCDPFPAAQAGAGCAGCAPTMAVTCEEVAILKNMRSIKDEVRTINDRLRAVRNKLDGSASGDDSFQHTGEWTDLTCQLDGLRTQWREWEQKLDEAIENKLIMLGHREPR